MLKFSPQEVPDKFFKENEKSEMLSRTIIGLLLPFCNLRIRASIRSSSKWHLSLVDSDSEIPFLTSCEIQLAVRNIESSMQLLFEVNPNIKQYKTLLFSVAKNTSPTAIELTQKSKHVYYDNSINGWKVFEPDEALIIEAKDVLKAITAPCLPTRSRSYYFLKTRASRQEFIDDMLKYSASSDGLRWYLRYQPVRSLSRLVESLGRYRHQSFKILKNDVAQLIKDTSQPKNYSRVRPY